LKKGDTQAVSIGKETTETGKCAMGRGNLGVAWFKQVQYND
jgi:hypothetical protein